MAKHSEASGTSQPKARRDMIVRLRRVEGQLRGIQKMIEEGAPCEDVAQQLSASRKALDKAFYHMLACVVEHPEAFASDAEGFSAPATGKSGTSNAANRHLKQVAQLISRFG